MLSLVGELVPDDLFLRGDDTIPVETGEDPNTKGKMDGTNPNTKYGSEFGKGRSSTETEK